MLPCSAVAIRQEIEDETKRYLQQNGKVVSADPIQLTVSSPLVPNLTLVDMPGLCQHPTHHMVPCHHSNAIVYKQYH